MARPSRRRRPPPVDIDDEDSVLAEMAAALGEEPDDLAVERSHMEHFGVSPIWTVQSARRARAVKALAGERTYGPEYVVVADDDAARDLALAVVKQDLEHEPEIFNRDFLERHIDVERLRRDLASDVENMIREDLDEEVRRHADDLLAEADGAGIDVDAFLNEEGDLDPDLGDMDEVLDRLAEQRTEERLRDPIAYLEDIYGREDALKQAMEIAGIDVNAAAEDAVDTDGWQHFLARYDGQSNATPGGFVYWREN